MNAYLQILRQPVDERRAIGSLWLTGVLVGLPLLVLVLSLLSGHWLTGARVAAGILMLPSVMWWGMYISNSMRQNTPVHARLVPLLRRRLMRTTAATWALAALLLAGIQGMLYAGHFGQFLVAIAALLLLVAAGVRYLWLTMAPGLWSLCYSLFKEPINRLDLPGPDLLIHALGNPKIAAASVLLLVLAGWPLLRILYPDGGDRHWSWHHRLPARLSAMDKAAPAAPGVERSGLWRRMTDARYAASLRRDTTNPAGGAAARQPMLIHALGPSIHTGYLGYTLLVLLVTLLAKWAGAAGISYPTLARLGPFYVLVMALLPVLTFVGSVGNAMRQTATEQGLLRLTPAAPPAARLNRELARALLTRFFTRWLVATAGALAASAILRHGFREAGFVLTAVMLLLPLACLLLRDFTRLPITRGWPMASLPTVALVALLGMFALVRNYLPLPWLALGLPCAAISAIAMVLLWRRLPQLPPAFPACRMS